MKLEFAVECLCQLRHGGASRDRLLGPPSTWEIQKRGRWAVPNTLNIYDKPGRLQFRELREGDKFQGFLRRGFGPKPTRV